MKRYRRDRLCIKCGTTAPYSKYIPGQMRMYFGEPMTNLEYMERTCRHCKYVWHEHTLDYKGEE